MLLVGSLKKQYKHQTYGKGLCHAPGVVKRCAAAITKNGEALADNRA